ncbi:MAG TPA: carboxypeptidase-like regulatory domain-containing protein [Armatimonadota bacterium]|nr:carboxypeptidase-like regulatory domain-containing protein [Armatimonadota bacterium]
MFRCSTLHLIAAAVLAAALFVAGCGSGGSDRQPVTVAGTVKGDTGAPIAGALVTATISSQSQPVASTTTGSTGVYSLALPVGASYVIEASKLGFETQQRTLTTLPNLSFNFVLTPATQPPSPPVNLGGRVTSAATSAAVSGATVTATIQGQPTPAATTSTDANGRYGFWLPTNQTYVIAVSAAGFVPAQRTVILLLGDSNLAVDFALTPS